VCVCVRARLRFWGRDGAATDWAAKRRDFERRKEEWHEGMTWLIKLPGVGCSDRLREKFASRWQQWFLLD